MGVDVETGVVALDSSDKLSEGDWVVGMAGDGLDHLGHLELEERVGASLIMHESSPVKTLAPDYTHIAAVPRMADDACAALR